jgi:hypothetical protein
MEPTAFEAALTSLQTALSGNITSILPVAGTLFALYFGIKLIPRLIKSFVR